MAISLGSNTASLTAQAALGKVSQDLAKSYQRLSSGLRINQASDDAAGLAIASQLNAKSRVYSQAVRNVNDGVSASSIAEGALNALKGISQRQLELAEEAANGTYSATQRQALSKEANSLVDEYNRIVSSTTFNGLNLFDPSLGKILIQAGVGQTASLQLGLSDQLGRAVGDGTFSAIQSLVVSGDPFEIQSGDLNGDGKLDLVSGNSIFIGNGDGTFKAEISVDSASEGDNIQLLDVNGDGHVDLLYSGRDGGETNILLGNGDGTFQARRSISIARTTTAGDFNRDGKLDLVGNGQIAFGNGDGTFTSVSTYASLGNVYSIAAADFNNDGILDVFAADYSDGYVQIRYGNGDGSFKAAVSLQNSAGVSSAKAFDINGDGNLDIVTTNVGGYSNIQLGNGDGTFKSATTVAGAADQEVSQVADINGDGNLDLFVSGQTGTGLAFGNGDGTFQKERTLPTLLSYAYTLADFNGDGRYDLAGNNGEQSVLLGSGGLSTSALHLNINTEQGARDALNTVQGNLDRIEAQLGSIGATTSRFQVAINTLQTENENFEAAAGRIQDVDVAAESANVTRESILQQAAASVLAQANQQPALALKLLGGR